MNTRFKWVSSMKMSAIAFACNSRASRKIRWQVFVRLPVAICIGFVCAAGMCGCWLAAHSQMTGQAVSDSVNGFGQMAYNGPSFMQKCAINSSNLCARIDGVELWNMVSHALLHRDVEERESRIKRDREFANRAIERIIPTYNDEPPRQRKTVLIECVRAWMCVRVCVCACIIVVLWVFVVCLNCEYAKWNVHCVTMTFLWLCVQKVIECVCKTVCVFVFIYGCHYHTFNRNKNNISTTTNYTIKFAVVSIDIIVHLNGPKPMGIASTNRTKCLINPLQSPRFRRKSNNV